MIFCFLSHDTRLANLYPDDDKMADAHQDKSEVEDFPLTEATAPPPIPSHPTQRTTYDHHHHREQDAQQQPQQQQHSELHPRESLGPLSERRSTHFYTLSYLVFFAILGTLARLGLQALTFYPSAPVLTGVLWANVGGSLLMGFFIEDRRMFREEWGDSSATSNSCLLDYHDNGNSHPNAPEKLEAQKKHKSVKKTIPLYIGLTTGFCGCFTSFSSFIRDVFLALANALPNPDLKATHTTPLHRNGGYSFMALVAVILITVGLSLCALVCGAHLALAIEPVTTLTLSFRFTRRILDPLTVLLGWGSWLGAIFLAIWPPDRHSATPDTWRGRAVFAIVFAPLGCLLRFYLALLLNTRLPHFPLGTFAANIFGTVIEGMCYDLQHVAGLGGTVLISCQVLQGVMDGFCGSTTTVSTWVAELNGLGRRRDAYWYGVVSVAVGLGFLVVIMGSLLWTKGFVGGSCS